MTDDNFGILFIIFICAIVGFFGYSYGRDSINIKIAYTYILEHPNEYMDYIYTQWKKDEEYRKSCVEDIDNCSEFIKEKKYREKKYKDDPQEMEKYITGVRNNILSSFSKRVPLINYTIDKAIGNEFSTEDRQYKDTIDVILNYDD